MNSPVVEILAFSAADLYLDDAANVDEALKHVAEAEGAADKTFRGREVEDMTKGYIVQVWDSLAAHCAFLDSPSFTRMRTALAPCLDTSTAPHAISAFHIPYKAGSIALEQPVLQILRGALRNPHDPAKLRALDAKIQDIERELGGLAFGGAVLEDPGTYCVMLGSRTVERDDPEGTSVRIMQVLQPYLELERKHVLLKRYRKE